MSFELEQVTVLEMDLDKCANTYSVAPCTAALAAGSECYNAFKGCQDKANFVKTTKTWSFGTAGANIPADEQIRPYIEKIAFAPTQIDLEKGLAPRGMVTITLADEPDSDIEADPYAATRASAATGSFWTRLLARNHNYAGRFARIRRAYLTGAWDWADFVDELYIIENIKGPDGNGKVQVVLKDPVKLTDRVKLPAASDGALLSAITDVSTTLPLESGQGADYPSSGWVRIGDEVIKYTTNSSDILGGLTRGDFDTTAATADAGDGVQLCQVWEAVSVSTVLEELANAGGIEDSYLDLTGWAEEDSTWLGAAFAITACISEPTDVSKLLAEVVLQSGGYMWWSPTEQKLKFKVLAPLSPGETAILLTDEANVIEKSVKVTALDQLRITRAGLFYDIRSAVANRKEAVSYLRGRIFIDADTESANEFNERRDSLVYSRLWTHLNDAAVLAKVSREVGYYREAPKQIDLKLDAKDASVIEGDLIDLEIQQITDATGAAQTTRCIVLKRRDEEGRVALTLRTTTFGNRYGFIGAAGIGDYPANIDYAHVAPAGGGDFSDGTGPYLIF